MVGNTSLVDRMSDIRVLPGSLAFYGLGQVSVAIEGPEGMIYVDPYLTDYGGLQKRLARVFPPPISPTEVTNATCVLVTHDHADHFDPETLEPLSISSPQARFIGPHTCDFTGLGIAPERAVTPEVGEPIPVGKARVTAVPSAHTELDKNESGYPYFGYVIEWNGVTVYHAGDTVIYDGLIETLQDWSIDVMFVPINGRDYFRTRRGIIGNMDFREAAELAEALDVSLTVPTHYDLIPGNLQNPAHFVDYLYNSNPGRRHHLLRPGELYYFVKERS